MNERIKEVRKHYKLSQVEFGNRIKITQGAIASYESGARKPLDAVVHAICKEFVINEQWLRTGEGEMSLPDSREEEIAKFVKNVFLEENDFRRRFITVLTQLSENEWNVIEDMAKKIQEQE